MLNRVDSHNMGDHRGDCSGIFRELEFRSGSNSAAAREDQDGQLLLETGRKRRLETGKNQIRPRNRSVNM